MSTRILLTSFILLLVVACAVLTFRSVAGALLETDRVAEYHKRNYTWPPEHFIPGETEGWKKLFQSRFAQVAEIDDRGKRYEGYLHAVNSAFVVANFTEHGFGLARAPADLLAALQNGIREGLPQAHPEETAAAIDAPEKPLFIDRPDLTQRVLHDLRHYAQEWSGMELVPFQAYGFRLYQNQSALYMHVDRILTHVISFILHIGSSDDAEPWPIFIEDFHGRTHEVLLTPGDVLFYESSKLFHGRPRRFHGSWYTSVFVHYYPANVGWEQRDHKLEAHYAVPPEWSLAPPAEKTQPRLDMVGTSIREPDCPDECCRCQQTVKWGGPGEEGVWIAPDQTRHPFRPERDTDSIRSEEL
jgi:hypothetical protein